MDLSVAAQIIGMAGTVVGTGAAVWSRRAARLSAPTGNGFANVVLGHLTNLNARMDRMESRLDNLDARTDPGLRPGGRVDPV